MSNTFVRPARWVTAVETGTGVPMSHDAEAIGAHLLDCRACQGRWFSLACAGETLRRFLAPRLITTIVAAVAVGAAMAVLVEAGAQWFG